MSQVPSSDRAFIERFARHAIVTSLVVAALLALLFVLRSALTPLIAAFAFAYLVDPVIDRLETLRIPRRGAIFLLIAIAVVTALATGLFLVPRLRAEVARLAIALPGYVDAALANLGPRLEALAGLKLPTSFHDGVAALRDGRLAVPLQTLRDVIESALRSITGTLGTVVGLAVLPVIAYYALLEFDAVKRWFLDQVPVAYREAVASRARTIDGLLSGFIRGQLIVCAILGTLYALGFTVIGIDLALVIGLVAGALAIIPYVGSAVALTLASLMSLLQFGFDWHLGAVVGWYAAVQALEGIWLTPRIVGRSVGIHPVAVILALLIGGDLLGFLGLLVAVPLAAVVQVFAREGLASYRSSTLYRGEPEPAPGAE